MPDIADPALLALVRGVAQDIADIWAKRPIHGAVDLASQLAFGRNGMRAGLEEIAGGNSSEQVLSQLKRELAESIKDVEEIKQQINRAKDRIRRRTGGYNFAQELDEILYSEVGKEKLRIDIEGIANNLDMHENVQHAKAALNSIAAFNMKIRRLHQMASE